MIIVIFIIKLKYQLIFYVENIQILDVKTLPIELIKIQNPFFKINFLKNVTINYCTLSLSPPPLPEGGKGSSTNLEA